MMENLRRLVWKTESLSEATATTTEEKSLPTIPEDNELDHFDQEEETVFYMFPIKQETPLGEWMMGRSQSDYIVKCKVNHY